MRKLLLFSLFAITVCVLPAQTKTKVPTPPKETSDPATKLVLDKMKAKVPLQKLGNAEDIANVNAFLASDEADYINGATISVDGGISL